MQLLEERCGAPPPSAPCNASVQAPPERPCDMCEQEGTNCTEAQEVCGSACFGGDEVAFNNCVFDFCALGGDYGLTETCAVSCGQALDDMRTGLRC